MEKQKSDKSSVTGYIYMQEKMQTVVHKCTCTIQQQAFYSLRIASNEKHFFDSITSDLG